MAGAAVLRVETMSIDHHLFCEGVWRQGKSRVKPMIKLKTSVDLESYDALQVRRPRVLSTSVRMSNLTNKGASITVAGMEFARQLGVREDDLLQTSMVITSANDTQFKVLGAMVVDLQSEGVSTKEFIYICRGAKGCLLSLDACVNLGIVPVTFPTIGSIPSVKELKENMSMKEETTKDPGKEGQSKVRKGCDCRCPDREMPSELPTEIPFPATKDNREKLESWIRERYKSSAFNVCECQPLPTMHQDPLMIRVKDGAVPKASHSSIPVPAH